MAVLEIHDRLLDLSEAIRPLSGTVIELAAAVSDATVEISQIGRIVSQDPGLVAPLLREANSAVSGASSEVTTVDGAIVRLGIARVLAVATASALHGVTPNDLPGYDLAGETLWAHAKLVSQAAECVRRISPVEIGPEVVTAALLHDFGKVVLGQVLVPYELQQARVHNDDITTAERELISLDHAEVGALLLQMWNLPTSLVEAVRHHHWPSEGEGLAAHAVHVADTAAWIIVEPDEHFRTLQLEASLDHLGLSMDQVLVAVNRQLEREADS